MVFESLGHGLWVRFSAAFLALSLCFACADDDTAAAGAQEAFLTAKAKASWSIPLAEVSGLAQRPWQGSSQLLAIGDADYALAVGSLSASARDMSFEIHDLGLLFTDLKQDAGSQWEAVASDASGRVFVLEESPGRVFVLSAELDRLEHTYALQVEANAGVSEELVAAWRDQPNSRGEGLVLLTNGHLLVLKEKRERALIEFGPRGARAEGYRPELAVTAGRSFPSGFEARESELVALQAWSLGKAKKLPDASELAVNEAGELFVLSDEGRAYARAELPIETDAERVELGEIVRVSKSDKPEGMTVLADGRVVVASDQKKSKNNAVVYAP